MTEVAVKNPFRMIFVRRRLAKLMKPDPEYRARRLAQFSPERRARYERNVEFMR